VVFFLFRLTTKIFDGTESLLLAHKGNFMKTVTAIVLPAVLILASSSAIAATNYTVTNGLSKPFTYKAPPFTAQGTIGVGATASISAASAPGAGTLAGYTTSYTLNVAGKPVYSYCSYYVPTAGLTATFNTNILRLNGCSSIRP
jgi:hypothetical protein